MPYSSKNHEVQTTKFIPFNILPERQTPFCWPKSTRTVRFNTIYIITSKKFKGLDK